MVNEDTPLTPRMTAAEIFSKLDHMDRRTAGLLQALARIPSWARGSRGRTMTPEQQLRMARALSLWESDRIEVRRADGKARLVLKDQSMMTIGKITLGDRGIEMTWRR